MAEGRNYSTLDQESLRMHAAGRPGKIEVVPTKPLTTQYHLSLAYSPAWRSSTIRRRPTTTRPRETWSPSSPTAPPFSASAISAHSAPSR
mgnify:CR=1 FL=1